MANNITIVQNIKIMKIFFPGYNIFRDYDHVNLVLKLSQPPPPHKNDVKLKIHGIVQQQVLPSSANTMIGR